MGRARPGPGIRHGMDHPVGDAIHRHDLVGLPLQLGHRLAGASVLVSGVDLARITGEHRRVKLGEASVSRTHSGPREPILEVIHDRPEKLLFKALRRVIVGPRIDAISFARRRTELNEAKIFALLAAPYIRPLVPAVSREMMPARWLGLISSSRAALSRATPFGWVAVGGGMLAVLGGETGLIVGAGAIEAVLDEESGVRKAAANSEPNCLPPVSPGWM